MIIIVGAVFLVGTKADNDCKRMVSLRDVQQLASIKNISFIETSTKSNINVDESFTQCASLLFKRLAWPNYIPPERVFRQKVGLPEDSDWIVKTDNFGNKNNNASKCNIM